MSEIYSASRLRDYASAWRALGCSCNECSTCAARDLTSKEADEIADYIELLAKRLHAFDVILTDMCKAYRAITNPLPDAARQQQEKGNAQ